MTRGCLCSAWPQPAAGAALRRAACCRAASGSLYILCKFDFLHIKPMHFQSKFIHQHNNTIMKPLAQFFHQFNLVNQVQNLIKVKPGLWTPIDIFFTQTCIKSNPIMLKPLPKHHTCLMNINITFRTVSHWIQKGFNAIPLQLHQDTIICINLHPNKCKSPLNNYPQLIIITTVLIQV